VDVLLLILQAATLSAVVWAAWEIRQLRMGRAAADFWQIVDHVRNFTRGQRPGTKDIL
jgi:hypothetical protein